MKNDLEKRVARIEDEKEILQVLHAWCSAADRSDEAAWVDCFTEDAVSDLRSRDGEQLRRLCGRHELRQWIAERTQSPEPWHRHMVLNPVITVSDGTATCTSF